MSAIDPISYRKYENKNIEFSKIPKASIIASLQNKNPKELQCKLFNNSRQDKWVIIGVTRVKRWKKFITEKEMS